MPTTPSPFNYNSTRYRKVPKRVKKSGGGICGLIVLAGLTVTLTIFVGVPVYIVL